MAYKSMGGGQWVCTVYNDKSWLLDCSGNSYSARHNNKKTDIPAPSSRSSRVGVYLDWPAGTLSFYSVSSDTLTHLHTFHSTFTEPLYPGFYVYTDSSVSLCQITWPPHAAGTQESPTPIHTHVWCCDAMEIVICVFCLYTTALMILCKWWYCFFVYFVHFSEFNMWVTRIAATTWCILLSLRFSYLLHLSQAIVVAVHIQLLDQVILSVCLFLFFLFVFAHWYSKPPGDGPLNFSLHAAFLCLKTFNMYPFNSVCVC